MVILNENNNTESIMACELKCPNCQCLYDEAKQLPCDNTICNYCLTLTLNENATEFKCTLCNNVHTIPKEGFKTNESIMKLLKPSELTQTGANFKKNLDEMTSKLKQAEFDLNNGDYLLTEYYRELKREVQLAKELLIQEVTQLSENMISQIEQAQSNSIEAYAKADKQEIVNKLKEFKSFTTNWNQNLISKSRTDSEIEAAQIKLDYMSSKLASDQERLKNLIFNNELLEYSKSRFELDSNAIGRLRSRKLDEIDVNKLEKIDMFSMLELDEIIFDHEEHKEIEFDEFSLEFFDDGKFLIAYTIDKHDSSMTVFGQDMKSAIARYDLENGGFSGVRVLGNKVACLCSNTEIKRPELCVFNESLHPVCTRDVKNQRLIGVNESYVFCYLTSKKQGQKPIVIYSWSLQELHSIGQKVNPNEPFYFTSNLTRLELCNGKCYFVDCRAGVNYLRIIDEKLGHVIRSVEISDDAQELKIDANNNIVIFNCDDKKKTLSYYNLSGDFLKEVKLGSFPYVAKFENDYIDLFAFDKKNSFYFFDPKSFYLYFE